MITLRGFVTRHLALQAKQTLEACRLITDGTVRYGKVYRSWTLYFNVRPAVPIPRHDGVPVVRPAPPLLEQRWRNQQQEECG